MVRAVIEIGAAATSMLVAASEDGRLRPVLERRLDLVATRLGARALASVVASEAALAREAGAASVLITLAPELRGSHLSRSLERRLQSAGLGPVHKLTAAERGTLSFRGVTTPFVDPAEGGKGAICVVELGTNATALAVGASGQRPRWWASRPLHAERLLQSALRSDPPAPVDQVAAFELARSELSTLKPPAFRQTLISGPEARLLALLCGERIDSDACERAADRLGSRLSEIVAAELGIDPAEARRLPALLAIVRAAGELIGFPLRTTHGGLAEGLMLREAETVGSHEPA